MSRCFPFPPPGYEKKPRTTEPVPVVDLLKKEKHKSKKDKKEKKDREKREGKERKHKDKNKEKHGEKDKQEKDREKKKDKDREKKKDKEREKKDKEKSKDKGGPSTEKTPEHQPGSTHEPKNVERQKTDDHNNINKKFVDELQQRIRNEVAGDRMVEHISRTPKLEGKFDSTILQKRPFSAIAQHPIKHDGSILPKRMHNEIAFKKNGNTSTMPEGKVTGNSLVHNINVELDVRSHIEDQKDAHKKPEQKGKTADSVNSGKVELVMDKKIEKQDKATDPVNIGKIGNDAVKKTEKKDKATDHSSVEKFGRDKDKEKKEKKEKKKDRKDKERTKDGKDRDKKKNKDGKDRHKNKEKKEKDKVKDKKHKENKQNADAAATELHILNNLVTNETEKQHPNKIVPSDHTENQHKFDGNLKRKVMNGFQHETLPNKLPKVVPSSLLPLENGRKPHLPSSSLQYQSDKQAISNSIKLPSPSHITSNSIRLPSPPHITSNSIKLPSPSHITSNSIKLPSPSHGKDQKLNGTVHLPTAIVPSSAVVNAAAEIDHVTQRPAQPGPSKVSPNAASRDAAENFDGSKRPFQSLPPRISSSSVVSDAAEINEASQRPPKSLTSRASLNAVIRDVAGANENSLKLPKPLPTKASQNAKVRDAGEIGEVSQRPPHPDEKYLAAVLHVPKLDEWPETDDQEWLFKNGDVLQKKPTHKAEVDDEPQVWSKAQRIESSDVLALPYVIPY